MRRPLPLFAVLATLLGAVGTASADPQGEARAAYHRAGEAESELRFPEALAAYRDALALDPSAAFAGAARARAQALAARAEGGFAPLARLERVRRDPAMLGDRGEIEALAKDLEAFPEGLVRSEARLVVAEAWWHRLGEPARAAAPLEAVLDDDRADRLTRAVALNELVSVNRELGNLGAARAAVDRWPDLAPTLRAEVVRLARRTELRWMAAVVVGTLALIGVGSFVRLWRRRSDAVREVLRPLAVGFALYVGAAGALLVRAYGDGDARPFVWFGLGLLGVDVAARSWRLASAPRGPAVRAARAAACVAAVVAVAFLAVERVEPAYLEGFGL